MNRTSVYIFDFDNTLIIPDAQIKIKRANGDVFCVHSSEYEKYDQKPGDIIDFSDFENNTNYKEIDFLTDKLVKLSIAGEPIIILSARNSTTTINHYVEKNNIKKCLIAAIGVPAGQHTGTYKAGYIKLLLNKNFNINYVEFYDDRHDCVTEVAKLHTQYPDCTFKIYQTIENSYIKEIC